MKQRIITGVLFTLAMLAFVIPGYFHPGFIIALTIIVSAITSHEMAGALNAKGIRNVWGLILIGTALSFIPAGLYFYFTSVYFAFAIYAFAILMFSMVVVILPQLKDDSDGKLTDGIAIAGSSVYVSFPIACANIAVLFLKDGWLFVVLGLFAPWISDVFAYFVGVLFGKHKIVPHISPKKTWEGCIGGAVGCSAVIAVVFSLLIYPNMETRLSFSLFLTFSIIVGLLLSIVSQLGDWTASSVKRWAGIKDFGTMLPGHGGLLDRFDSAFFTLPVAFVFGLILI
ncbi:MAG: phosphatidate cytidylyltransferase [Clostridiales bacterium]|nr:phosphatidate cytidylyltransferase [Clostridiales bacterium]